MLESDNVSARTDDARQADFTPENQRASAQQSPPHETHRARVIACAERYRSRGWAVVRLKAQDAAANTGGKAAFDTGWQKTTPHSPMPDFLPYNNIGIVLGKNSGDLVRLDPEYPRALPLLRILFPEPCPRFGRPSARGNAYLVRSPGGKSKTFALPNEMKHDERLPAHGVTVAQILAGGQTMAPPSQHPDTGELLEWEEYPHDIPEVAPAEIERRMSVFAALSAITQFWPAKGTRNEAAIALSRVLIEAFRDLMESEDALIAYVDGLVTAVAMAGGDGEGSRKGKQRAAATLKKMNAGEDTTGLPRLIELLSLPPTMEDTVRKWLNLRADKQRQATGFNLEIGSDVEVARRICRDLTESFGQIVNAEGEFWRYAGTHWEPIQGPELRRAVHRYDGALYPVTRGLAQLRLTKGRIDSVLNELAALWAEPAFFEQRPIGINCASGFIRFACDGTPSLESPNRDHRCRHTLPGHWHAGATGSPPAGSLMSKFFSGIFLGDADAAEKVDLLSEVCGVSALGYATRLVQPRAVILYGQTAENGKSQFLDQARGLLPPNAVSSVPAGRMGDERHVIGLANKLLNATDELSSDAIASDRFKSVVTGEPVDGRDVYKSRVEFRSMAQNLFASNSLPPFQGGIDRGVQRRLLVIPFNRTIPEQDRVENIGRRIAEEEPDLLLAWAVRGASRVIQNRNFSIPMSCKQALTEWIFGADPVLAWIDECTDVVEGQVTLKTRDAHANFREWAQMEGYKPDKLPAINGFTQRVMANVKGIEKKRNQQHGRHFVGLKLTCRTQGGCPF